jgi:predicted DNA-binding WGR domain protein
MKVEVEKTELEYRDGTSDKVYIATLYKIDEKYQVMFSYGRRYNVNNHSMKPEQPVTYGEAVGIYNQQVAKKRKKGYVDRM